MTFFSIKINTQIQLMGMLFLKAVGNTYQKPLQMTTSSDLLRSEITIEKEYSTELKAQTWDPD